ncbi:TPA: hypothetical protein DEO28_00815 [Candidatus Dependentiae bacterium]|nr:MAG: Protein TolB [candidate division TM6 bacterium GW2011_GWE2_31_21]KKP54135.1 MAG: Protein TolB [candidate division TM6 bacterium GW2011_GWF2_33_332]HBS47856.1 hypothetical protein [Candidatus Dependentiae bacterium]HBZ73041.1 hypothetical protein [Candidatus Dependentiae bacterium]
MSLKFLKVIIFASCFTTSFYAADNDQIKQSDSIKKTYFEGKDFSAQAGKSKCFIFCLNDDENLAKMVQVIEDDLKITDVFEFALKKSDRIFDQKEHFVLFEKEQSDYSFYLQSFQDSKIDSLKIKIVIKNNYSNATEFENVFEGKRKDLVWLGHNISNNIMEVLTGKKGIFMQQLVYCKFISQWHKVIMISDYRGNGAHELVSGKGINSVPTWHQSSPILFYTKLMPSKSYLIAADLKTNKHKIVCDFDGLNMQPSVSQDGKKVALCLAKTGNSEIYLFDKDESEKLKKRAYKQITKNSGNNVSPIYLPNGNLIFCSDFEIGIPQIYHMDMKTNKVRRLTKGSYSAAPSYCNERNSIVYTKVVDGIFQLFTMDLNDLDKKSIKEEQLTFGKGDKQDPCVADNGDYIYFSYRCPDSSKKNRTMQIAVLNIASKNTHVLTDGKDTKSFPKLSILEKVLS